MDFLNRAKKSLGLAKKENAGPPVTYSPPAPLTPEQRQKHDMDRLYDNKKTPYSAKYTSEVNVRTKGSGLSETKSDELRSSVSPPPKRAEDKKEKKSVLGAFFSSGGGDTSEGSSEVYGKNSYQYIPNAKSSSSAPQQSYQRTGVVKPVQKNVQENTSLYDQKIGRHQSNMYHVALDKPVEVEETNDDEEYDNSEEMARLAEQDRLRREAEEKKYKMSLKFSPTTNSMYYDKNVENIRKGYTKAKSFVGGAQLAPLSFWASKTASRLNLDLSNYTKELQTYRIDLPSESNCYFEVTINSEQTPMSYIQIGMMEMRHTVQHTKEKRFINEHGQTICLGVGRTKGSYSFDALFHRKAERKSATAAFLNNQDIITRKDYRAMQTQKYGNGKRLLNQDTYAAIDNGKLHNKYGHHQLHLSKGSVIGCYLDYVNRCIHISADGQFTGHLLPLADFHERNRDARGNLIREAFCPVITALPSQEFFVNVGQEPFKLDSTSINGEEEGSDYGRSSFQELIENSRMKRNGDAVEEGKGNKEDVNHRAAYLEVEDGAFVHEAVLHRCMARNSSQASTPHVDIWDEDDNEWLNISEELHPWFFKGEAYNDYEEGEDNHIDNVTAPMIPSDQLISGTKGGVHDGENVLRPLRRKSNFVSAEDFQEDEGEEDDEEDDNKSVKSITVSEADKFDSQIRDHMHKKRNTLQLKSMETEEVNFNKFKNKLINPDLLHHDFAHNANPEYYNSLKTKRKKAVAGEEVKESVEGGVSATKVLKDVLRDDEIMLSDLQAKYVKNRDKGSSGMAKAVSFDNTATIEVKDVTETAEMKYRRLSVNVETKLKFEMEKQAADSKKDGRFKALHKQLEDVGARIGADKDENPNKKEKAMRSQSIRRLRNSMHGLVDTHNSEEEELAEEEESLADEEHLYQKSKLDRRSIHALQQNKQAFNKQSKETQGFNLDVAEERRLRMTSGTIPVPNVPSQVGAPDTYFRQKMNGSRKPIDEASVTPSMEFNQTLSNMRGNAELHKALEEQPMPHEQYKIQDEIDNVSDFSDDPQRYSSVGMQDPVYANNDNNGANYNANGSNNNGNNRRPSQGQQKQKPQKKKSMWGAVKGMFGFGGGKKQDTQEQPKGKNKGESNYFGFGGTREQKADPRRQNGGAKQDRRRQSGGAEQQQQQGRRDDNRRQSRGNSNPTGRNDTMPSGRMSGQMDGGGGDRRRSRSDPKEQNQRRPSTGVQNYNNSPPLMMNEHPSDTGVRRGSQGAPAQYQEQYSEVGQNYNSPQMANEVLDRRSSRGAATPQYSDAGASQSYDPGLMNQMDQQYSISDRRPTRGDSRVPSEHGQRSVNQSQTGQSYSRNIKQQQQQQQQQGRLSDHAESRQSGYTNSQMNSQMNRSRYSIGQESYQESYQEFYQQGYPQQQQMGHQQQNMNNMNNVLQEMNNRNSVHNVNVPPAPSDDGRARRRTMAMPEEQQQYAPDTYQESYYGGSDADYDAYNVYDQYENSDGGFAMENEMNNYRNDQYNNSDLREEETEINNEYNDDNYQNNEYNINDHDEDEGEDEGGDTFDVEEKKPVAPPTKAQEWMNKAFAAINPDHTSKTPTGVQVGDALMPMRNASVFKQALANLKPVQVKQRTLEKHRSKASTMRERRDQQNNAASTSPKPSPSNRRASVLKTQLNQNHSDESEEELDAVQQELQREMSAIQQTNAKAAIPPPPPVGAKTEERRKSMASQLFDSLSPETGHVEGGKKKRRPTVIQQQASEQAGDSDWEKDSTDGYRQSTALDILDMMPENAQEARGYRSLEQELGGNVPMEHRAQAQGEADDSRRRSSVASDDSDVIDPSKRKSLHAHMFGEYKEPAVVNSGHGRPSMLQMAVADDVDGSDWEDGEGTNRRQSTALDILNMVPGDVHEALHLQNREWELRKSRSQVQEHEQEHSVIVDAEVEEHNRAVAKEMEIERRKSAASDLFASVQGLEPQSKASSRSMSMAPGGPVPPPPGGKSRSMSLMPGGIPPPRPPPGGSPKARSMSLMPNQHLGGTSPISRSISMAPGDPAVVKEEEEEEEEELQLHEAELESEAENAQCRSMSIAAGGIAPPPPGGKSRSMSLMPTNQPGPPVGASKSRSMSLMPGGIPPPRPPLKSRAMSLTPNQFAPSEGSSSINVTPFTESGTGVEEVEDVETTQRRKSLASHVFEQAEEQDVHSSNRRPSMIQEQVAQDVAESDWEGNGGAGRRISTALEILDMVPGDAQQARAFQNAEKDLRRQSLAETYQSDGPAVVTVPEGRRRSLASHVFGEAEKEKITSSSYVNRRPSMIQEEAAQDVAESDWEGDDRDHRRASTALEILAMVPDDIEEAMAMQNREWKLRKRESVSEAHEATRQHSISAGAVAEVEETRRKSLASHVFEQAEEQQHIQSSSGKGNRRPSMIQEQAAQGVAESDWEAGGGRKTSTALEILDMLPADTEQAMAMQNREWELRKQENEAHEAQAVRNRSISADAVRAHNQNNQSQSHQNGQKREFLGPAETSYNLKSDTSLSERREMNIYDRSYIQNPYANVSSDAPQQDLQKQRRKSNRSPEFEGHGRKTVIGANLAALNRMSPTNIALSPPKFSMTADAMSVSDNSDLTPSGSEAEDEGEETILDDEPQHMQKMNSYESEAYYNSDTGLGSIALQEVLQHRLAEERKRLEEDQKRRIIMMVEQLELEHRERIREYQKRDLLAQQRIDSMENVQRSMQDQQGLMAEKEMRLEDERRKLEREKEDHFQALAEALETERLQLAAAQQETVEIEQQKIIEAERMEKERRLLEIQRLKLVKELELERHKFQLEMLEEQQQKKVQIMREEGAIREEIRRSSQYAYPPIVMTSAEQLPGADYHDSNVANSIYSKDGPPTDKDIAYLYGNEQNSLSQVGNSTIQSASQVGKPSMQTIPPHVNIVVPGPPRTNTVDAIDISTRASMIVAETLAARRGSGLDKGGYHETYRNPVSAEEFRAKEGLRKTINNMFMEKPPLKPDLGMHPALLVGDDGDREKQDSPSPNRRNSRSNRRSFAAHIESTTNIPRRSKTFNGNNNAFNMGNGRLDDETQISDLDDENNRDVDDPRNTAQEIINNLKWNLNGGQEPDDATMNSQMVHEYLTFLEGEHEYEQQQVQTSNISSGRKPLHDWMQEQVAANMKQAEEAMAAHTKTWNELYKRNGMLTIQEQQQLLAEREEAAQWKHQYRMLEVSQEQLRGKITAHEQNQQQDKALTVDELNIDETAATTVDNNTTGTPEMPAEKSADDNDDIEDDDSDKEPEPPKYEPILDTHHAIFIERHVEAAAKLKVKVAFEDEEKKRAKEIEEQEKIDNGKQGRASLFKRKKKKKLYRHQQRKPAGEQVPGIDELKERFQMMLMRLLGKKDIKEVDKEADVIKLFSDDPFESRKAWHEYYETHPDEYEKMMKPHWKKYPEEKEEYFDMKAERERLKKLEECRRDTPEYYRAMMLEKADFGDSGSGIVGARCSGGEDTRSRRSSVAESPIRRKSFLNEMTLGLLGGHDDLSHLEEHPSLKKVKARDHPGYESNDSSDEEEEVFDVDERQKHRDNFMVRASFMAAANPSEIASNADENNEGTDKSSADKKKGKTHVSLRASICHDHPGFVYESSESEAEDEVEQVEQVAETQEREEGGANENVNEEEDNASQGSKYGDVVKHRARTLERRSFAAVTIPTILGDAALTSSAKTQSTKTASTQDDAHPSLRASICRDHPGTEYDSGEEEDPVPVDIQYMRMISQRAKLLERASFASTAAIQNGAAPPSHISTPNSNASSSTRRKTLMNELTFGLVSNAQEIVLDENHPSLRGLNDSSDEESEEEEEEVGRDEDKGGEGGILDKNSADTSSVASIFGAVGEAANPTIETMQKETQLVMEKATEEAKAHNATEMERVKRENEELMKQIEILKKQNAAPVPATTTLSTTTTSVNDGANANERKDTSIDIVAPQEAPILQSNNSGSNESNDTTTADDSSVAKSKSSDHSITSTVKMQQRARALERSSFSSAASTKTPSPYTSGMSSDSSTRRPSMTKELTLGFIGGEEDLTYLNEHPSMKASKLDGQESSSDEESEEEEGEEDKEKDNSKEGEADRKSEDTLKEDTSVNSSSEKSVSSATTPTGLEHRARMLERASFSSQASTSGDAERRLSSSSKKERSRSFFEVPAPRDDHPSLGPTRMQHTDESESEEEEEDDEDQMNDQQKGVPVSAGQ